MKKTKKWLICALTALSMGLAISATACAGNDSKDSSGVPDSSQQEVEKSIALNVETVTIKQFDTAVLTYTLTGIPATTEVVWTSSDSSAVSVEKGKISAYKTGTVVITVSAGGYSDSVTVTVEASNDFPQLTLSQTDAKLKVGKTVTVYSDVVFRGESVDDQPEIEWSTESDAISLTPKADGSVVITAVKPVSQAVVQAKTTYFGKEIIKAVVVEVVEDTEFSINAKTAQLYTYTYGEEYKESTTLEATVLSSGNEVSDAVVEWSTDDDTVATVVNGVVTAVAAGEATITAKYVSPSGMEHVEECIVTVSVPTIQTGKNAKIYLDSADGDQVVNLTDDLAITNTSLAYKVIDAATNEEMDATIDGVNLTFAITDKKLCGERAIKLVVDGKVEINATVTVVTKVLMTAEEVANIKTYGVLEDVTDTGYTLYGYFLLGADVDLSGVGELGIRGYSAGNSKGFIGGFDGQGHTIANMKVTGSGLFGEIAKGTVIRNTAFMGVTVNSDLSGVLGKECYGVIENCLIDLAFTHGVNMNNCSGVVDSLRGDGAALRNSVVYYPETTYKSNAVSRYLLNGAKIENVVTIGEERTVDYDNKTNTAINNVKNYATGTALADIDFSYVTGDYWKFDGEKVYFVGYDALIKAIVNAGEYPESITNGEAADLSALPANLKYVLEIADEYKDYVTLDGTTLTIANEISGNFSFNITVSKWNGIDLGVSKTVNVVKIQNIVIEEKQEYMLYKYSATEKRVANTAAFTADLSTQLSSDIPSGMTWKLYQGATDVATVSDYLTVNGKTLSIPAEVLVAAKLYGEFTLQGESTDGSYKIKMPVALITMGINNESKAVLADFLSYADVTDTTYSAYFVLTGNIDASDMTINTTGTFNGIFDGRGYAIDGMTTGKGGLFNAIGINSVVKNLAVTNTKIVAGAWDSPSVMTGSAYLYGKIEDCYIEIVSVTSTHGETYPFDGNGNRYAMGVCGHMDDGEINNVIVKIASGVVMSHNVCNMMLNRQDDSVCTITNTYVIGGVTANTGWNEGGASVSVAKVTGLTVEQQASFNSDVWTFDEAGTPSFKNANE